MNDPNGFLLLVEDEWLLRMELAQALGDAGWTVLEAENGERALTMLAGSSDLGLLVTDVRLGGPVTGWDVADAFRERHPGFPVVYVSANSPQDVRRVPASLFFSKPLVVDELVRSCNALRTPKES